VTLTSDTAPPVAAPEDPGRADLPAALRPFARMIGGTWRGVLKVEGRDFAVESRHDRALQGQAGRTPEGSSLCGGGPSPPAPLPILGEGSRMYNMGGGLTHFPV
jgi:hypothetical protein